jgi:hypothetical protein
MDTIVNRSSLLASGTSGLACSTCHDHWVLGRNWGFRRLHRSERRAWIASWGERPAPVVWGKYQDTTLFLFLWTPWLHPEACGHPERFSVVLPRPSIR